MQPHEPSRVAVVVPAFNAANWIADTLTSLQQQTVTDWVCIVVDDGSVDDTAGIVQRFTDTDPRISLIRQPNAGVAGARNTALAALPGTCPYVAFLDSDDVYEPDALAVLIGALSHRPDAVGAYGLAEYIDQRGNPTDLGAHPSRQLDRRAVDGRRMRTVAPADDTALDTMVVSNPIWPAAVALHRLHVVRAVGGFDPSYTSQEDWALYQRLVRRGPYVPVRRQVAWYRRHDANLTARHDHNVYNQDRLRYEAYRSPDSTRAQIRQVRNAWRYLEARQAVQLSRNVLRNLARRQWRAAGMSAVGALISAVLLLRPAPPTPSLRRVRYTRPASLPGAQLQGGGDVQRLGRNP